MKDVIERMLWIGLLIVSILLWIIVISLALRADTVKTLDAGWPSTTGSTGVDK